MSINIKRNQLKRVVIVGGGLGGLRLAEDLSKANLQVVLIDKNNFHQFPPLIYQIASAGIDPSSISFPFRQIFRKRKNFYFRMAEARAVFPDKKILQTSIGKIEYDYLVFAAGTTTNFYGNANIEKWAIPMKTVSEAMGLRNAVLSNLERALTCATEEERQELLNVVIVGGGATGVEIAGALSEMKRYESIRIPYQYGCGCTVWQNGNRLQGPQGSDEGRSGDSYPHLPLGIRCKGTAYHRYRWRPSGPWFPNRSR